MPLSQLLSTTASFFLALDGNTLIVSCGAMAAFKEKKTLSHKFKSITFYSNKILFNLLSS